MRVAAISDVHGNAPALEAVLAEIERESPDLIVSCGDLVAGPLPIETLETVRRLDGARFVRGNADRFVVEAFDGAPPRDGLPIDWDAAQIDEAQRDFLAGFEDTLTVDVEGLGRVLFCHGTPASDVDLITAETPEERLRELLAGVDADVVVCGHTHMQFDRTVAGVRVLNCGSVGMPYGEPGAYWALLGPGVELRRTEYDREAAAARIGRSSWEGAEAFARENVLRVPSVDDAMAFFRSLGGP